jgi:uncharacterized protein
LLPSASAFFLPPENAMTQTPVASPCTSVCRMHARTGWCEGCLRTLEEIAVWSRLTDADKRQVWRLLDQRRTSGELTRVNTA